MSTIKHTDFLANKACMEACTGSMLAIRDTDDSDGKLFVYNSFEYADFEFDIDNVWVIDEVVSIHPLPPMQYKQYHQSIKIILIYTTIIHDHWLNQILVHPPLFWNFIICCFKIRMCTDYQFSEVYSVTCVCKQKRNIKTDYTVRIHRRASMYIHTFA